MDFYNTLRLIMKVKHEYAPGIFIKVTPDHISEKDFYPLNEMAETVTIGLEDGERFMDKFLFKKLYRVSEIPEVFSEEKIYHIPFTVKEFDSYYNFLVKAIEYAGGRYFFKEEMDVLYADYIKITNFFVPIKDDLYAFTIPSSSILEFSEVNLDFLPNKMADRLISRCEIQKYPHRRDLARRVVENPTILHSCDKNNARAYLSAAKELILELGGDFEKMYRSVEETVKRQDFRQDKWARYNY